MKIWPSQQYCNCNLRNIVYHYKQFFTVRPLMETEYSKKDYPITTIFENKKFSSFFFFANRPIKFKIQLCNHWKLKNCSNLPQLSGNSTQIYECFGPRIILRIFCFQKTFCLDNLVSSAPVKVWVPVVAL